MTKSLYTVTSSILDELFNSMVVHHGSTFSNILDYRLDYPHNIYVSKTEGVVLEFAAVGADKQDIEVSVEGNRLSIAKKALSNNKNGYENVNHGISKKAFSVSYKVDSETLDLDDLSVSLEKGLLTVSIPIRSDKKIQKRTIEVK